MSQPSAAEIDSWLRDQGIDPDRVVDGSLRGDCIDGTDMCRLVYVETPAGYTDAYAQRTLTVALPPWATHTPSDPGGTRSADARGR